MKHFAEPEITILKLEAMDVIATSSTSIGGGPNEGTEERE